jgi:hypothetical protein
MGGTRQLRQRQNGAGYFGKLDFAGYRAKYIGMVINALDQRFCRAGRLQIGK